jgi:anti-sigma B factor antagonist
MSTPSAKMLVSVGEKCACVKLSGRGDFASSVDLKLLFDELLPKGYTYFVLDLTECALMDSTFLGVLAGFGLKLSGPQPDNVGRALELYNPNPRITELLENLGVIHLFKVARGEVTLPEKTEPCEHTPAEPSRIEVKRACLEAHQILMSVNPANAAKFKDVAAFLAEDLKKLKANQG